VALKIIKPGFDSKQTIARFEAERQALAMMDHPNIARIIDAGTTGEPEVRGQKSEVGMESASNSSLTSDLRPLTSRPYFVMELVRGMPITEYCDKARLAPRQRLELFVDVCQAVQHAHQKGIIHRDLKPSNVMVTMQDGRPVVKVIDFGVAKAVGQQLTERTVYTALTQLVGEIGIDSEFAAENAVALGVRVTDRVLVFLVGPLIVLTELLDNRAGQLVLVGALPLQIVAVGDR
jgi:serine/threonine protein kinase